MNKLTRKTLQQLFPEMLKEDGYKQNTIRTKQEYLAVFLSFLPAGTDVRDIGKGIIEMFADFLDTCRSSRTGRLYASRTKHAILNTVKLLYRLLYQRELLLFNPTQGVILQQKRTAERKKTLTVKEMKQFLENITPEGRYGLRDRTLFELLYSSGLRVSEAANLLIGDVDIPERMILVKEGKWSRDRMVPISKVAVSFLEKYLFGRLKQTTERVFKGIGKNAINRRFKKLLDRQGFKKKGITAHSIRHSTATHLLANGADLRYVQELLGHQSIETTVVYTYELDENLRRIYKTFHPRENSCFLAVNDSYLLRLQNLEYLLADKKRIKNRDMWRNKKRVLHTD